MWGKNKSCEIYSEQGGGDRANVWVTPVKKKKHCQKVPLVAKVSPIYFMGLVKSGMQYISPFPIEKKRRPFERIASYLW